MSDVELICEKSFSGVEQEIVEKFVEFQHALIDAKLEKLNEILLDGFEFIQIFDKSQSKTDFLLEIKEGSLNFSKSDIMEPAILFDDENSASLIAKVRLTGEIHGRELRWISNSTVNFQKIGDEWGIISWEN